MEHNNFANSIENSKILNECLLNLISVRFEVRRIQIPERALYGRIYVFFLFRMMEVVRNI